MPQENLTSRQRLQQIFEQDEIVPANRQDYDMTKQENQAFFQHNSIERTKAEIDKIDEFLSGDYKTNEIGLDPQLQMELTELDKMNLSGRKTLDLSHLLLNNNMKSDSPEMRNVKIDILNLAKVVEKNKNEPVSRESMDKVQAAMLMAIDSCKDYLEKKNPTFSTGKARKQMVRDVWVSLLFEAECFQACRRIIEPGYDGEVPETLGDLMGMKREPAQEQANGEGQENQAGEAAEGAVRLKRPLAKDEIPSDIGPLAPPSQKTANTMKLFRPGYSFADTIKGKYRKRADLQREGRKVRAFYDAIKKFSRGKVEMADVDVFGQKIRLLQKSDGSTYVIEDHKEYPLGKSFATLKNQIEEEIFSNVDVYGTQQVTSLLQTFEDPDYLRQITSGEHNRVRTMLTNFLAQKTGLVNNDFNNTFKTDLMNYVKALTEGTMTAEAVRNEVVTRSRNAVFVNGVAISEMVALNQQRSVDEIAALVEMNHVDEVEVVEPGWKPEEQRVKNMIADLIFTNNTEQMDLSVQNPASYVKAMLAKHKEAMNVLLAAKGNEQDLVKEILDKMSIGDLTGQIDGQDTRLSDVVAETVNALRDLKEQAGEGEISDEDLSAIKTRLDGVVDKSCAIMQGKLDIMTNLIFPEEPQQQNVNKSLRQRVKDITKSDRGQGRFMRNVFRSYFEGVNNIDKRSMLASVFRTAKIIPVYEESNEDTIKEIKQQKIARYSQNFTTFHLDENEKKIYDLTEADQAALAEYREYRKNLKIQSNFLAGLLRGAGPLMHKMMQGIPTEALPAEIKTALSDVKTNLTPIPEQVVQSEFLSLVESSAGKVTKIEKIRSLGAASVGQAFLCKIYGPSQELKMGREVVIKLLRPEAKNRMQREEEVMLQAARQTDDAMYLTYKGQLDNYKKELDLSIEAENCKAGKKTYQGKFADVKSMDLFDGVPATSTSLVLEKAEGVTLDSYIEEVGSYADEVLDDLYVKNKRRDGSIENTKNVTYKADPQTDQKFYEKKQLLIEKIDEAIKRRDHIINLCNAWIDEAVMNSNGGFYHGDLHAGNIMINDNNATFIDYGNTVQLSKEQQKCIAQMTIAAAGSIFNKATNHGVDLFFEGFNGLLKDNNDPEFLATYTEQRKRELKAAFKRVLDMGDEHEAGFRISLCLFTAQEMGIKIPPAIQNFSQGQVRLQNSIDDLNNAIQTLKEGIDQLDKCMINVSTAMEPVSIAKKRMNTDNRNESAAGSFKRYLGTLLPVEEETFKQELRDHTLEQENLEIGKKGVNKRMDFTEKYLGGYMNVFSIKEESFYKLGISTDILKKAAAFENKFKDFDLSRASNAQTYRQMMREFFDKWQGKRHTKEHMDDCFRVFYTMVPESDDEDVLLAFGGQQAVMQQINNALQDLDWNACEKVLDIYEKQIPKAMNMLMNTRTLFDVQDKKKKMKDTEQTALVNQIYTEYNELHTQMRSQSPVILGVSSFLNIPDYEDPLEEQLESMFAIQQDGLGERLREKFSVYKALKKKYPVLKTGKDTLDWFIGEEDAENYARAKQEFMDAYTNAAVVRMQTFYENVYAKEANVKHVDFDKVMRDVMAQHFDTSGFMAKIKTATNLVGWLGVKVGPVIADFGS